MSRADMKRAAALCVLPRLFNEKLANWVQWEMVSFFVRFDFLLK